MQASWPTSPPAHRNDSWRRNLLLQNLKITILRNSDHSKREHPTCDACFDKFQFTLNQALQSGAGSGTCCERRSAPSFKPNLKWFTTGGGTLNICRSSSFIQIYAIIHFLFTIVFAFVFLSTADAPAELNCSLPHPRTWESSSLKYLLFDHFQEMFYAPS